MQSALSQTQLSLREGNFDPVLPKQSVNPIVDIAADLRVQTGTISPDKQTKIQRPITETQELHFGWRIAEDVVDSFGGFHQRLGDQIDVRTVSYTNGNRDARVRVTVGPIDQRFTHELGVGNDNRNAIVSSHHGRA